MVNAPRILIVTASLALILGACSAVYQAGLRDGANRERLRSRRAEQVSSRQAETPREGPRLAEPLISQEVQPFREQRLYGSGDRLTDRIFISRGPIAVKARHSGGSNFVVRISSASGLERSELMINEIGAGDFSNLANIQADGDYIVNVQADGGWELVLYRP